MEALSCAVGSPPSLIACRNEYGVSTVSPRVSASGETIDSDAPTGVPVYLALICAMSWLYRASAVVVNQCCWRVEEPASPRAGRLESAVVAAVTLQTGAG